TPNVTSIPYSRYSRSIPFDTAAEIYSKCAVSPLITAPRQMTASYFSLSHNFLAASGSSNEPGHRKTLIFFLGILFLLSALSAPERRPLEISLLNSLTTIAIRNLFCLAIEQTILHRCDFLVGYEVGAEHILFVRFRLVEIT